MKKIFIPLILSLGTIFKSQGQQVVKDTVIYYSTNKSNVQPQYQKMLSDITGLLSKDSTYWVEISGHADIKGPKEHNIKLSLARTESVIKYFYEKRIPGVKIKGYHFGSAVPLASNDTEEGRQKNRRVEIKILKPQESPTVNLFEKEVIIPRTEIDIHYNKEKFAYMDNSHRNILHTVRDAEVIFDTNTFNLPVRSGLFKANKVRLDFSEMDKKGEMVNSRVGLVTKEKELIIANYIFCIDSLTNQGLAHIKKDRNVEFLIPKKYFEDDSKVYTSPDHDRKLWTPYKKAEFNEMHNAFSITINDEGCFVVGKTIKDTSHIGMIVSYKEEKKAKTNNKPEFFFVDKNKLSIIPADSASNGKAYFSNLKEGTEGKVIGIIENDGNLVFLAQEDLKIKANHHHNNKKVYNHGHVKFLPMPYFDLEKSLLSIQ